jgi:hypothetical protein
MLLILFCRHAFLIRHSKHVLPDNLTPPIALTSVGGDIISSRSLLVRGTLRPKVVHEGGDCSRPWNMICYKRHGTCAVRMENNALAGSLFYDYW